jgi:hypothetical protein
MLRAVERRDREQWAALWRAYLGVLQDGEERGSDQRDMDAHLRPA